MSLQIIQAKPNPAGKDSNKDQNGSGSNRPEQLFGEWVDVKNIGADEVHFPTMQVRHALFDETCHSTGALERVRAASCGAFPTLYPLHCLDRFARCGGADCAVPGSC